MTEQQQFVAELRKLRFDRQPTLTSIAQAAGISRTELYRVINTGQASDAVARAIEQSLRSVTKRAY